jgi:TPP-dependent pyruvate/acetoin dehydrogenase alpha subunit
MVLTDYQRSLKVAGNLGCLSDPNCCQDPVDITGGDPKILLRMLQKIILIRCAEEKIGDEVSSKRIVCPCHLVIGQEAAAVGIAEHIKKGDRVFGAHRSHAHFLALGGTTYKLMAEVQGKDTGCSRGMGGSMHLLDIEHHLYGTVPIVAATIPIATGAALAAKMDKRGGVAVSFFGDGATEEGVFHEALNLAAVMKLPVIFVCENNFYSSHLHISLRQPSNSVCRYAEAHCVKWERVDGNDMVAMCKATENAIQSARSGGGPQFIEAVTYRWRGHVGPREDNDVGVDRKENLLTWKRRDPLRRLADALMMAGALTEERLDGFWRTSREEVESAWNKAAQDPYPPERALLERVYSQGS